MSQDAIIINKNRHAMYPLNNIPLSKKRFKNSSLLLAILMSTASSSVAYADTVEVIGSGPYWDPGTVLYNGNPPPGTMAPLFYFDGDTMIMGPNYTTTDSSFGAGPLEIGTASTLQFNFDGNKANPFGKMEYLMTSVQFDANSKIKFYMPSGALPAPAGTYELIVIDPAQASTLTADPTVTYTIEKDAANPHGLNTITSVSFTNNKLTIVLGGAPTPPNPPVNDEGTNTITTVSAPTYQIQSFTQQLINVSGSRSCATVGSANSGGGSTAGYLTNFRSAARLARAKTNRHIDRLSLSPDSTHGNSQFFDMMRLADDGQLPETQFIIPATDLRFWATGMYNSFYNKLDNMDFAAFTKGVQVGMDSSKFGLPIGISFAYSSTKPNLNNVETGRSRTLTMGIYGGYALNDFTIFGTASYLDGNYKRDDAIQTSFSTKTASLYLQGRYAFALTDQIVLEPLVGLTYARTWTPRVDSFQNGALLSQTQANQSNYFTSDAGFIISKFFYGKAKDDFTSKIFAQASWTHNYTSTQKAGNILVAGNPIPVASHGQRQALNTANLGVGLVVRRENIDVSLSATAGFARRVQSYGGLIGIRISI